jgi:hypothetical protein
MNLRLIILGILALFVLQSSIAIADEEEYTWRDSTGTWRTQVELDSIREARGEWLWVDSEGTLRSGAQLDSILGSHKEWVTDSTMGKQAILQSCNLSGALMWYTDLSKAFMSDSYFRDAIFEGSNLSDANLNMSNLSGCDFWISDLSRANLWRADLRGAYLGGADLCSAKLSESNLSYSDLSGAYLFSADLEYTNLDETYFHDADFTKTLFYPSKLPDIDGMAEAINLDKIVVWKDASKIFQLAAKFEDAGFKQHSRMMIRLAKRYKQDVFSRVFFDWTIEYGYNLWRPWFIIIGLWFLASTFYFGCFLGSSHKNTRLMIIQAEYPNVHLSSTEEKKTEKFRYERVHFSNLYLRDIRGSIFGRFPFRIRLFFWAMFFSAISALNVGFRKFSTGRGLLGLTRKEIELEAHGWVRVVSGAQSLVSAYLILLWAANLFATPFK